MCGRPSEVYESVSQSDNAGSQGDDLAALVQRVIELLGSGRAGLVTDVDGTISPIVARPEDAHVLPKARSALEGLRDLLTVVAVVSGRRAADARRMVDLDGLTYVGNHGIEIWRERSGASQHGSDGEFGAEILAEARPWVPRLAAVLEDVQRQLPQSGILVENKGATASLHYRLAPDPDRARRELLEILARCAITSGLRVEEGRMVLNLLPPLTVTKGSAVTWLAREHRLQRLVYLGDDVTDAHAFKALGVLRQSGEIKTLGIGVVGPETPPSVCQLADASVPSVEAVADLLWNVLEGLRARASDGQRRGASENGRPRATEGSPPNATEGSRPNATEGSPPNAMEGSRPTGPEGVWPGARMEPRAPSVGRQMHGQRRAQD